MGIADLALRYGIALLIGVLIGVEREYARLKEEVKSFAGVRTFPLIALLGCSAALLTELGGEWTFGILAGSSWRWLSSTKSCSALCGCPWAWRCSPGWHFVGYTTLPSAPPKAAMYR